MRYKVPQDVQQADRIVGPLTAIQLVECVIGGFIVYFFYTRVDSRPVGIMLAIVAAGITVVFVFVRIQEMSFARFLVAMTLFLFRPRVRTWKKLTDTMLPPLAQNRPAAAAAKPGEGAGDAAPKQTIRELTRLVDTHRAAPDADGDVPELVSGRENTLERIREIDEKLRARQDKPVIPTNA